MWDRKDRKCDRCNAKQCVQCCEWAGRYFMNGGDHVTAAPPEADISHWLSTSAHWGSASLNNPEKSHSKWARCAYKPFVDASQSPCTAPGLLPVNLTAVKRLFYEWRLWYVNERDWEKKMASSALRRRRCRVCLVVFWFPTGFVNYKDDLGDFGNDHYVQKSWRTRATYTTGMWSQLSGRDVFA